VGILQQWLNRSHPVSVPASTKVLKGKKA